MKQNILFIAILMALCVLACRKKQLPAPAAPPIPTPQTKGVLKISIENMVAEKPLSLGGLVSYDLGNGENFTVSEYNYYLTNIALTDDKGNEFIEAESYHLIRAGAPTSLAFEIKNIPSGNYKSIRFLIGVDSLRNISGVQNGALDPSFGMFWSWSSGYIMAKMEGSLVSSGTILSYHVSGFKGEYNVLQNVVLTLPQMAIVSDVKTPSVTLRSDLAKWFKSPNSIKISENPVVGTEGALAFKIAQNYKAMMSISKVENP